MAHKIFIDGAVGTTGLEIRQRLTGRRELVLLELAESERKDMAARARVLNEADLVILCLPDEAAREAVALITNPAVRVIDASTAHRTAPGWTYGFPELEKDQREKIAASKRVSNPGCWATAFIALVRPLVRAGVLPADFPVTANGVSGYSGGGKSMIAEFENKAAPNYTETVVRNYALTLSHKHLPEMKMHTGLAHPPVLAPFVGRFYRGMLVEVPLALWALPGKPSTYDLQKVMEEAYAGSTLIQVAGFGILPDKTKIEQLIAQGPDVLPPVVVDGLDKPPSSLDAEALKLTNGMKLFVFGNDKYGQVRLVALLDNLGKGASGAAVQNMNIMLGLPETAGLV